MFVTDMYRVPCPKLPASSSSSSSIRHTSRAQPAGRSCHVPYRITQQTSTIKHQNSPACQAVRNHWSQPSVACNQCTLPSRTLQVDTSASMAPRLTQPVPARHSAQRHCRWPGPKQRLQAAGRCRHSVRQCATEQRHKGPTPNLMSVFPISRRHATGTGSSSSATFVTKEIRSSTAPYMRNKQTRPRADHCLHSTVYVTTAMLVSNPSSG